jgi:hypothetical protein
MRPLVESANGANERAPGPPSTAQRAPANRAPTGTAANGLIDISARFQFTGPVTRGNYAYVEARGELGRPGTVVRHRSPSAQRGVSAGTGDDAGHLIGDRFGPPGDARNLTQQHRYMNQNGTFRRLEDQWERLLHAGTRVEVHITDIMRVGDPRPFGRIARWTQIAPNGMRTQHSLSFVNVHNPLSRRLQNIPAAELPPGWVAPVIPIRRGEPAASD